MKIKTIVFDFAKGLAMKQPLNHSQIVTGRLSLPMQAKPFVINKTRNLWFLMVLLCFPLLVHASQDYKNFEDEALHSRLVNVAMELDWLNQKCRGLSVERNFKQVNRLFINKYSLSANNYIEGFFAREIRDYKADKSREMIRLLAQKKGCKQALKEDWDRALKKEFNYLFRKAEDSSWFPVVDRLIPADLE